MKTPLLILMKTMLAIMNNDNNNINEHVNEDDENTGGPMMSQVDQYDEKSIAGILLLSDLWKKT